MSFPGAPRIHRELLALGFEVSETTISRYLQRLKRRTDQEKAKRWLAFLHNHREVIVAPDFFTVPTITFQLLYDLFCHRARSATNPAFQCDWIGDRVMQQLRETFPAAGRYRYVILTMTRNSMAR